MRQLVFLACSSFPSITSNDANDRRTRLRIQLLIISNLISQAKRIVCATRHVCVDRLVLKKESVRIRMNLTSRVTRVWCQTKRILIKYQCDRKIRGLVVNSQSCFIRRFNLGSFTFCNMSGKRGMTTLHMFS